MKFVHKAMNNGSEDDGSDGNDREATVQCVKSLEEFAGRAALVLERSHASEEHRRVEERVGPAEILDGVVPHHSGEERDDHER